MSIDPPEFIPPPPSVTRFERLQRAKRLRRMVAGLFCLCVSMAIAVVIKLHNRLNQQAQGIDPTTQVVAQEGVKAFGCELRILEDASVVVSERIPVHFEADPPRHGLVRNLKPWYLDGDGKRVDLQYEILSVYRNDTPENFIFTQEDPFLLIKGGQQDVLLEAGDYVYIITYKVRNAITFHADREEFIWTVAGNWPVPIPGVEFSVKLPQLLESKVVVTELTIPGFSPSDRSIEMPLKPEDYEQSMAPPSEDPQDKDIERLQFKLKRSLSPGESLKLNMHWPKGYLKKLN